MSDDEEHVDISLPLLSSHYLTTMHILFALLLQALHLVYKLVLKARSFWAKRSSRKPEPLLAARGRIPKHLAILFVAPSAQDTEATKAVLTESILDAVKWCRSIGIAKLTVYEEHGAFRQFSCALTGLSFLNRFAITMRTTHSGFSPNLCPGTGFKRIRDRLSSYPTPIGLFRVTATFSKPKWRRNCTCDSDSRSGTSSLSRNTGTFKVG